MARTRLTGSTGARLLKVLDVLASAGRPLSLREVCERVELPKPTVYRLVGLLEEHGYAIKDVDSQHYRAGPTMRRLSLEVLHGQPWAGSRHAILERLAGRVGEACNLVLLDGYRLTYIDRVDTQWPLRLQFEVGSHVPVHCTATGKLLLALQPARIRQRLIRNLSLEAMTEHSIVDPDALEQALHQIRQDRVGTDDQEFLREMVSVAVPIPTPEGPPAVAVSIHAPVFRHSLDDLRSYLPDLREAATALAEVLYPDERAHEASGQPEMREARAELERGND